MFARPIGWCIVGGVWAWGLRAGSCLGLGSSSGGLGGVGADLRRGFGVGEGAVMPKAGHRQCLPSIGIAFYPDSIGNGQDICFRAHAINAL